ncbi:MAG TPA: glycosyltransferase family 39 protein, partial [Sunxiuqinia sp.]|nr:glycosyltransferase family 39 protein [Sunxiuqinia sp.]
MNLFKNLEKKHYLLLAGWLVINIIQSIFTELHADESYYWLYSQHLAWGFFDHPPMVAVLIHLGYSIMHNELGVRIFILLISTLTVAILMNELNEKKDLFFMALFLLSFPLMHTHIGGFIGLPDIPLVFFTLLFFLVYRKFVAQPTYQLSLLLGVLGAAMIFSKYHAFLVLGMIILSNLKLLKSKYFWLTLVVALLLLSPHIWWQIDNHFPTFKYHLHDRSKPFQFKYVFNNLLSQLVIMGPLTGWIIFYSLKYYKVDHDPFRRAIVYNIVGFYVLFFIMSFWNRIEAHWTTAITPLLIIATYPIIKEKLWMKKWFRRLAIPTVAIFFLMRFYLAANFIPNVGHLKLAFYNREATSKQIQKMAHGKMVAFFDNFASPGMYEFYTGEPCVHLATADYRFCQFDLWDDEARAEGDTLFVVIPDRMDNSDLITLANGKRVKTV